MFILFYIPSLYRRSFFFHHGYDTRHTLQPHSQKPLGRKVRSLKRTGQTFLCARTCVATWRGKSVTGEDWELTLDLFWQEGMVRSKPGSSGRTSDLHLVPWNLFDHSTHLNTPRNSSLDLVMQNNLNPLIPEICIECHELDLTSNKIL